MMKDICVLTGDDAIKAATEDQVKSLLVAIDELSAMAPSVPDVAFARFIHMGEGAQYNNTGSGSQFYAGVIHLGKN
jgi:hypothetical protein